MTVLFYPAKVNDTLNGLPFEPERAAGMRAMVNPLYPATVAPGTRVVCDSTAFQTMLERLTPRQALDRQLAYERSTTRDGRRRFPDGFEALVSYDMLVGVDEAIEERDGELAPVKRRGTEETAAEAVRQTIASAEVYHRERHRIAGAVAYAAQGATLRQYMGCVRALLDLLGPRDWLALGGFCIIGMQASLKPFFLAVCREVAPLAHRAGIRRVHVLGVCVVDVLLAARAIFAAEGIEFSTDSSSLELNSIMGRVWSEEHLLHQRSPWKQVYTAEQKGAGYKPAELAEANVRRFAAWCERPVSAGSMPITCVCSDGHDGLDWITIEVSAAASLETMLAAAEVAGMDAVDVLRIYTQDGCYQIEDGRFDSWRVLERECKIWKYAIGRERPPAPKRPERARPRPFLPARQSVQLDMFQGAA